MVSCAEFLNEFGDYLEGEVTPQLRRELETHLARCRTCQVIVDSTRKTLKIVTESGEIDVAEPLPEPLVAEIMKRIHQQPEKHRSSDES